MLITMNGVAREQMPVKPTMSLNNMVTSGYVFASIVEPKLFLFLRCGTLNVQSRYIFFLVANIYLHTKP